MSILFALYLCNRNENSLYLQKETLSLSKRTNSYLNQLYHKLVFIIN